MELNIGKTIAELRKNKGWTQVELAQKLNVSDKAVSKWESGKGYPDTETLPLLSDVFGVSIDYLFAGEERNNIVLMSTMEYCAKSNDPSFLEKFRFDAVDEHNHDIIHYVKQYQSLKVMTEIIRREGFAPLVKGRSKWNRFIINEETFKKCLYYATLTNTVDRLIKLYKSESDFYRALNNVAYTELETAEYSEIFKLLLDFSIVSDETRELLFSFNENSIWEKGVSELFHTAVASKNWNFLDKFFSKIKAFNAPKVEKLLDLKQNEAKLAEQRIYILKKTILLLVETGELERAKKYYKYNCTLGYLTFDFLRNDKTVNHIVELGDILRVAELKSCGASEREIRIQSAIHGGILFVDELFETGDYPAIEEAIRKYPIHTIEKTKDLSSLWEVARRWENEGYASRHVISGANGKYIQEVWDGANTIDEALQLIEKAKQLILERAKLRFDKRGILEELTREYFFNQLEAGNEEMVIIKLCKRLEAVLKGTYFYKGDFLSMLNQYIDKHEQCWDDDRELYYNNEICTYLHKLRITRNNLVRAENTTESMTKEDIVRCIDYICNMK